MQSYSCETKHIHLDTVKEVQKNMIKDNQLEKVSQLFKIISDPTRIKMLYVLEKHELCVCDISVILNMTQSAISHQLKTLKDANLVKNRRDGKTIFYQLADEHVHLIFNQALTHINE